MPGLYSVESQAELLAQRLSESDAGFTVYGMPADRLLPDALEQLIASVAEPVESFLFVFSGYAVTSEDGVPTLLLDGERLATLALRRVRRIGQSFPSTYVVLDTVTAFDVSLPPEEMVRQSQDVLSREGATHALLAAHRTDPEGPSPLLNLIALVLDWSSGDQGLSTDELFDVMRREEALFAQIPYADYFPGAHPFWLLVPRSGPSIAPSAPPPPSGEGAEARADALVAEGKFEEALTELAAALEHSGPSAGLYSKAARALTGAGRSSDALAYYDAALALEPNFPAALGGAAEIREAGGDKLVAVQLLKRWLAADPNSLVALERAARLLGETESWDGLARLYETVLPQVSDPAVALDLARKHDELCEDLLNDARRALPSLERAAALAPGDADIRLRLAAIHEQAGDPLRALPHLLAAVRARPDNVAAYRRAMRLYERSGQPDGAWNAACALEVFGDADVNESLLAAAHRPEGLLSATGSLSQDDWARRLLCPERDAAVDELFSALGGALVQVGLETAARKRRAAALDPAALVDPATSTATLVRMLSWTARLLGMPLPKVYLVADARTAFQVPATEQPAVVVGKALGTGLGMPELAFLWGRELAFLRPEHQAFRLFPSVAELSALVLGTLSVGGVPQLPFKKLEGDAKLFARALRRHLRGDALEKVSALARDFPLKDAAARVLAWVQGIELAAMRSGLLACGNPELAAKMTRTFPLASAADEALGRGERAPNDKDRVERQVRDLLAYSIGEEYSILRERLGIRVSR